MRSIIESWDYDTRWSLLNKTQTDQAVFNAYKADTDLLKAWKDFYKEANTKNNFINCSSSEQVQLLQKFGKNSTYYEKIVGNPDIISPPLRKVCNFEQ